MKRRSFITLLGGAAAAWPLAARAKVQPKLGLLSSLAAQTSGNFVANIYRGLKDAGFVTGQNLNVEERWADAQYDRLPAMAKELVDLKVDAIVTIGGNVAASAAKAVTSTIPIVFATADDPVATGLVASLNRPSANLTGVTWIGADLQAKYLELLHELLPGIAVIGLLLNPQRATAVLQQRSAAAAAASLGTKIRVLNATSDADIDAAFKTIAAERISALIVGTDALFNNRREKIVSLATQGAVPSVYFLREFAEAGGLMSYGANLGDGFYQTGVYAGRILKGARPADLPVQQATKVELVINLRTAKALGLTIPITLLGRADEVIE